MISSIGVALAMVRETVERVIPNPTPEDLQRSSARRSTPPCESAPRPSVEVTIEVDRQTQRVRAIAMGASEMRAKDPGGAITEREAHAIAARSLGLAGATLRLVAETSGVRVYSSASEGLGGVRAVDRIGAIRVQRSRALVCPSTPRAAGADIARVWRETSRDGDNHGAVPGLFLLYEHHVADLSGVETLAQAVALAASELEGLDGDAPVVLVGVPVAPGRVG